MRQEDRLLFELAGEIVENRPETVLAGAGSDIDWPYFHRQAVRHEIVPLLYLKVKRQAAAIPAEYRKIWEQAFFASLARSQCFQKEFQRVDGCFRAAGIRMAALKGIAFLNSFLKDYPGRMMTDLDVLIPKDDLDRSVAVLEAAGYCQELYGLKREYWTQRHYHLVFRRDDASWPSVVELHWGLDYPGQLSRGFYDRLWARTGQVTVEGKSLISLSAEDHFISLALHLRRFGNVFNLKHAVDAAFLIRTWPEFDWDYLSGTCRSQRFCSAVQALLCSVRLVSGGTVPVQRLGGKFPVSVESRRRLRSLVADSLTAGRGDEKRAFFGASFFLYDSLSDVWRRFVTIPLEQFAKFFDLEPYAPITRLLYAARFVSAPVLLVVRHLCYNIKL